MNEPMSDERLAELREFFQHEYGAKEYILNEETPGLELVSEVTRLRAELAATKAENERYRIALLKIEMGHSKTEPGRLALAALNQEPAP